MRLQGHQPIGTLFVIALFCAGAFAQEHPRLLFGAADLTALRAKKDTEPFKSILSAIQSEANSGSEGSADYTCDMRAVNCAFMSIKRAHASACAPHGSLNDRYSLLQHHSAAEHP